MPMSEHDSTRLIRAATSRPTEGRRPVSPPVERASTLLNPSVGVMRDESLGPVYGIDGLAPQRALAQLVADLERAERVTLTSSGLSAVTLPILALARAGDEVLTTDAVYGPSRRFLTRFMAERGVTTRLHPAEATAAEIAAMIGERTRIVLIESPASLTFEMIDVPALATAARAKSVVTIMDNTWAAGVAFKPLVHGVDVSVQALTKYVGGHSDLLMGAVATADARLGRLIHQAAEDLGGHVSPDDAWLALRGARTLKTRLDRHAASALQVAEWLADHPKVARVLYPPLPGSVGHDLWARDYTGAAGLMGVVLNGGAEAEAEAILDRLTLFGLGYSWGGFESLATHETGQLGFRQAPPRLEGPLIRLHIGLENADDLIADLEGAFAGVVP